MPIIQGYKKLDSNSKVWLLIAGIAIVIGIPFTINTLTRQTVIRNNAAEPVPTINQPGEIINTDDTMGPQTIKGNFSSTLPKLKQGEMEFAFSNSNHQVGDAQITALNLIISKAETRMVYLGTPGDTSSKNDARPVDYWETLNLPTPITVDLIALSKSLLVQKLGLTDLAAGKYTEIRLYIKNAFIDTAESKGIPLVINGKDNILSLFKQYAVEKGKTTRVIVDFDAQASVVKEGETYILKPFVKQLTVEMD